MGERFYCFSLVGLVWVRGGEFFSMEGREVIIMLRRLIYVFLANRYRGMERVFVY